MNNNYIVIRNQSGEWIKWTIEDKNEKTYEVRYNGLVTRIYKSEVYTKDDGIMTTDIIKATKFNNGCMGITTFGMVRLEN